MNGNETVGKKCYHKLRVNINGFKFEEIKVSVENDGSTNSDCNIKLKITANRRELKTNEVKNSEESNKEYVKCYDILSTSEVIASLRYYLDSKNPMCLIIVFDSNLDENVFLNLDDSFESIVETAAKSLLNFKNIDDIQNFIKNPFETDVSIKNIDDIFTHSMIRELNLSARNAFTPMKIVQNSDGTQSVRIKLNLPNSIKSASLTKSIYDQQNEFNNHLKIKCEGLNLFLEANTTNENVISMFSKQLKLPIGTVTENIKFNIDEHRSLLNLEAPFIY